MVCSCPKSSTFSKPSSVSPRQAEGERYEPPASRYSVNVYSFFFGLLSPAIRLSGYTCDRSNMLSVVKKKKNINIYDSLSLYIYVYNNDKKREKLCGTFIVPRFVFTPRGFPWQSPSSPATLKRSRRTLVARSGNPSSRRAPMLHRNDPTNQSVSKSSK